MSRPSRGTVLVVDDDDDTRLVIKEIFEDQGFEVVTAANGREAFERLDQRTLPVFILLDLMMPEMDGWTFRHLQQQMPRLAGIPVAVFSGREEAQASAESLHAAAYIKKPLRLDGLLVLVEQMATHGRPN